MKTCSKCQIVKPIECFGKLKNSRDGLKYDCKQCRHEYNIANSHLIREKNKLYYENNKERVLETNKEYRLTHVESIRSQRKQYRSQEHVKLHIKEKCKEYLPIRKEKIKQLRKESLTFQISEVLRSKFHKYLNNQTTSMQQILGCDLEFFKKWIEYRFDESINWNNYGTCWHIDHVLPINQFNLTDETDIRVCYHWTNLQPLLKFENQSKSDNILLHHYFNNMISVFRFNAIIKHDGYQAVNESLQWLRSKLRYGKNPTYECFSLEKHEIGNPQPRL